MAPNPLTHWQEKLPEVARDESLGRLRDLARLVAQRKVQFLCGAGMSRGSGLPLASDLAAMMVGEIIGVGRPRPPYPEVLKDLVNRYPLEAIAEAYLKKTDTPRLRDFIAEELGCAPGGLHDGHRALEYLASQGYIDRVYTTNFDNLIEEAFGGRGCTVTDKNADALHEARTKNQLPVFHLHGTVNSECLIAEGVTYSLDTPLARFMMADMVTSWFVWVGYSLTDPDLRTMYFSMQELLQQFFQQRGSLLLDTEHIEVPVDLNCGRLELFDALCRAGIGVEHMSSGGCVNLTIYDPLLLNEPQFLARLPSGTSVRDVVKKIRVVEREKNQYAIIPIFYPSTPANTSADSLSTLDDCLKQLAGDPETNFHLVGIFAAIHLFQTVFACLRELIRVGRQQCCGALLPLHRPLGARVPSGPKLCSQK